MIIICSWCKKWQGEKEPLIDERVTNSICDNCADMIRKIIKEQLRIDEYEGIVKKY